MVQDFVGLLEDLNLIIYDILLLDNSIKILINYICLFYTQLIYFVV